MITGMENGRDIFICGRMQLQRKTSYRFIAQEVRRYQYEQFVSADTAYI